MIQSVAVHFADTSASMGNQVAEAVLESGAVLRLIHGDLTDEAVDAIVNAANAHLAHGGGVAGAIARKGGPAIDAESREWVREHGPVRHDAPAVTGGGRLPCRYVIHAVGPVWGEGDEETKLRMAVSGALRVAGGLGLKSLALPAISTGIFGFPKPRGAQVILDTIVASLAQPPAASLREVRITLIDQPTVAIFAEEFGRRWPTSLGAG
jgi:O-acetyl-ADP-ribose deacetylase (regulator of RNase III)